jgi:hypothetical protein
MVRTGKRLSVLLGTTLLVAPLIPAGHEPGEPEPTAAEAGAILKAHVLRLIEEVSYASPQVTDPGGRDIPCGDGKVKRTFAATGPDAAEYTKPRTLNLMMLSAAGEFADYDLAGPGGPDFHLVGEDTRTSLHLNSTENGRYSVSGETDCLDRS